MGQWFWLLWLVVAVTTRNRDLPQVRAEVLDRGEPVLREWAGREEAGPRAWVEWVELGATPVKVGKRLAVLVGRRGRRRVQGAWRVPGARFHRAVPVEARLSHG